MPSTRAKGRATGGVRCHRFLKGEDILVLAWAGARRPALPGPTAWPWSCPTADGPPRRLGVPGARGHRPHRRAGGGRRVTAGRPATSPPARRERPDACSVRFDGTGSAPTARRPAPGSCWRWSSPGPGGATPRPSRTCRPRWAGALDEQCGSRGGRLALLRAPGPHADDAHDPGGRTAYLAFSGPQPWLLVAPVTEPGGAAGGRPRRCSRPGDREAAAASLPGAAASRPGAAGVHQRPPRRLLRGPRPPGCPRGRAGGARARLGGSHTGGHRFAPTGVLLPHGATLARLDATLCAEVLESALAGQVPERALGPLHDRGRSALRRAEQAAESHVRHEVGETSLDALASRGSPRPAGGTDPEVAPCRGDPRDGRRWLVEGGLEATGETTARIVRKDGNPAAREWPPAAGCTRASAQLRNRYRVQVGSPIACGSGETFT